MSNTWREPKPRTMYTPVRPSKRNRAPRLLPMSTATPRRLMPRTQIAKCLKSGNQNRTLPLRRISRPITIRRRSTPRIRIAVVTAQDGISAAETAVVVVVVVVAGAVEADDAAVDVRRVAATCLLPSTPRRKAETARAIPEVTIHVVTIHAATLEAMTSADRAASSLASNAAPKVPVTPGLLLPLMPARSPSCSPANHWPNIAVSRRLQRPPLLSSQKDKNATTNLKRHVPTRRQARSQPRPVFPGGLPADCRVGY